VDSFLVTNLKKVNSIANTNILGLNPASIKVSDFVILTDILRGKAEELNHNFKTSVWCQRQFDFA